MRIPEAEIRAVTLGHAPGRYTLTEVDAAIRRLVRSGELVETESRGADRAFVTDRAVKTERRMLAAVRAERGRGRAETDPDTVAARLRETGLTEGQKEAVRTVLLSRDRIVGVQGHAGSGKTTMLRTVKELLGGRTIMGLAPSASAARVLAREAGIPSRTLQWFLTRHGDLSDPARLARARAEFAGAVLAVDEASMIDTVRMEALLRIAPSLGVARVALVGDTAQLRAVDAGQPFRVLQKAGMATALMDEVLRQKDPDLKKASGRARAGEPGAAVRQLGPRVHEHPREELGPEAGRRWLALAQENRADALILAPTHAIRRQVNDTVREGLEAEGLLHGRVLAIDRLVDRRLTRAQASDIRSHEPGDTIVFHRSVFGCQAGDVCMVTGAEDGHVVMAGPDGGVRRFRPSGNAATYFGLYDTDRIEVRAGDRIRWTRNRKAPPPRFGHPRQPDLVNGGEAEIVDIDRQRVLFRDDAGRTFPLRRKDPQLRHLDHAWCSTVHAAQGRTARIVIAVLDAHGAVDQAMFHVEVSRASEAFQLLTDDREALVEMLEARPDREDGALEALGLDPAEPPVVEPELFEAMVTGWRALRRRGEEAGTPPFLLPGADEAVARAAAFSLVEELPADMRVFVDGMLAEHERHVAHEREMRGLADRLRAHWRRWPELGWLASARGCARQDLPEHAAWRVEGALLLERARRPDAVPGIGGGLKGEVAALERMRLRDDCERFRRDRTALRASAVRDGIPELHLEGCAEVAELAGRLSEADGLDPADRRLAAAWLTVHDRQAALAGAIRSLPGRVEAWRARREADLPLDEHGGADPVDPACRTWREEGGALRNESDGMLEAESAHGPHIDAMPGAREAVAAALAEIDGAVFEDRFQRFAWLTRHLARQREETRTALFHLPRYPEALVHAGSLHGEDNLDEERSRVVGEWLRYDERCTRLCGEIRNWPARADALLGERPGPGKDLGPMRRWRTRAEPLLAEGRAMLAKGSPHGPHLAAMPEDRGKLAGIAGRLENALAEIETAEVDRLLKIAGLAAERTGGIASDTAEHADPTGRGRLARDRARVEAFLDLARKRLAERDRMDGLPPEVRAMAGLPLTPEAWKRDADAVLAEADALGRDIPERELKAHLAAAGAGPDAIDENTAKIEKRLREDEEARAAERQRLAEEQALAAPEAERLKPEEERKQDRSEGGGMKL